MKVAVIGGGSAGFMAAAHLTRHLPQIDLHHIYDNSIPPIGVGEGTTPPFVKWIHETTGLSADALRRKCCMTIKQGIIFENWGLQNRIYRHLFSPTLEGNAYHVSAIKLIPLLQSHITATNLDRNVLQVDSDGQKAVVVFSDGDSEEFDFVIDARGFPRSLDASHEALRCIPTNAALIRRGPAQKLQTATRSVARPHGWVFVIPLTDSTSYGYVYNRHLTTIDELKSDFDIFLSEEGVEVDSGEKSLVFPNYAQRVLFDGAVFRLGNAASFVEPLEATAIAVTLLQLQIITTWLIDHLLALSPDKGRAEAIRSINTFFRIYLRRLSLFIGWHYALGAPFDTPFWKRAQASHNAAFDEIDDIDPSCIHGEFDRFVAAARRYPAAIAHVRHPEELKAIEQPSNAPLKGYGGFLIESFAKVGHGIGYY